MSSYHNYKIRKADVFSKYIRVNPKFFHPKIFLLDKNLLKIGFDTHSKVYQFSSIKFTIINLIYLNISHSID